MRTYTKNRPRVRSKKRKSYRIHSRRIPRRTYRRRHRLTQGGAIEEKDLTALKELMKNGSKDNLKKKMNEIITNNPESFKDQGALLVITELTTNLKTQLGDLKEEDKLEKIGMLIEVLIETLYEESYSEEGFDDFTPEEFFNSLNGNFQSLESSSIQRLLGMVQILSLKPVEIQKQYLLRILLTIYQMLKGVTETKLDDLEGQVKALKTFANSSKFAYRDTKSLARRTLKAAPGAARNLGSAAVSGLGSLGSATVSGLGSLGSATASGLGRLGTGAVSTMSSGVNKINEYVTGYPKESTADERIAIDIERYIKKNDELSKRHKHMLNRKNEDELGKGKMSSFEKREHQTIINDYTQSVTYLKDKLEKFIPYLKKKISKNIEKRMANSTLNLVKQIQNEDVSYQVMQNKLVKNAIESIETYIKLFPDSSIAIVTKKEAEKNAAKITNTSSVFLGPAEKIFNRSQNQSQSRKPIRQPPLPPPSSENAKILTQRGSEQNLQNSFLSMQNIPSNVPLGQNSLGTFNQPMIGNTKSQLNDLTRD